MDPDGVGVDPTPGRCCACGYRGEEETPCPLRTDKVHCECWWDGPLDDIKDVHTEHCCIHHGCKYGDNDCTVMTRRAPQSFPCEACGFPEFKMEQALRWIVRQFEENYMLNGVIVDNPDKLMVMFYEEAKAALDSLDDS